MLIKGNVTAEWFAFVDDDEQYLQVRKNESSIIMDFGDVSFLVDRLPNIDVNDILEFITEWYGSPKHFLQEVESRCSSIT